MKRRYLILIVVLAVIACPLLAGPYAWLDVNSRLPDGMREAVDPGYDLMTMKAGKFNITRRLFDSYLALWLGGKREVRHYRLLRTLGNDLESRPRS